MDIIQPRVPIWLIIQKVLWKKSQILSAVVFDETRYDQKPRPYNFWRRTTPIAHTSHRIRMHLFCFHRYSGRGVGGRVSRPLFGRYFGSGGRGSTSFFSLNHIQKATGFIFDEFFIRCFYSDDTDRHILRQLKCTRILQKGYFHKWEMVALSRLYGSNITLSSIVFGSICTHFHS